MAQKRSIPVKCLNDNSFGPTIRGCRSDFDFTVVFEQIMFMIVPSTILIIFGIARVMNLLGRKNIVSGEAMKIVKQVSCSTLTIATV